MAANWHTPYSFTGSVDTDWLHMTCTLNLKVYVALKARINIFSASTKKINHKSNHDYKRDKLDLIEKKNSFKTWKYIWSFYKNTN